MPAQDSNPTGGATSLRERREAAHRRRRLILDDDGDLVYYERTPEGPDAFCEQRLERCVDVPVDSVAWCIMWGIAQGAVGSVRYWQTQMQGVPLQPNMPDPTPVVEHFCKEHGIEVFGSIRMNDCHDAYGMPHGRLLYPLKVEHPEFLIGDESQHGGIEDGLTAAMWSGLDYAHDAVREDRLWWIAHTASAYDLDGVDLNFFRMPWYFKVGEEAANAHLMTDLIRSARQRLDLAGRRRGRPMLLGVRTPGTVETCLRIGLDVETWLSEGLIDRLLTGGGYASFSTPAEELVELGHRHDVPVYPCINCPSAFKQSVENGFEALRGAASNMWWSGADGLYLWNYQYLPTPHDVFGVPLPQDFAHLADLADPGRLARLDKVFAVNKTTWEQYARATAPCPLPAALGARAGEARQIIRMRVGDNVAAASGMQATLQVELEGAVSGDRLLCEVNDARFEIELAERVEKRLDPSSLRQGDNGLAFTLTQRGPTAHDPIVLNEVRMSVRYES